MAQGYEISSVVGTSMGAIVGALFAYRAGVLRKDEDRKTAQRAAISEVRTILLNQDFSMMADLNATSLLRKGVVRGDRIQDWLAKQLLDYETNQSISFADLNFDLTVTATDAYTGDPVYFSPSESGDTAVNKAVRASISIPSVFVDVPVEKKGKQIRCWDGGMTGNCRFDYALRRPGAAPLTVASSVTYRGGITRLDYAIGAKRAVVVFNHVLDITLRHMEETLAEALGETVMKNVLRVVPNLEGVGTLDFSISRSVRERLFRNGRAAMREKLKERFR